MRMTLTNFRSDIYRQNAAIERERQEEELRQEARRRALQELLEPQQPPAPAAIPGPPRVPLHVRFVLNMIEIFILTCLCCLIFYIVKLFITTCIMLIGFVVTTLWYASVMIYTVVSFIVTPTPNTDFTDDYIDYIQ
jgi:hypothetical protein